MNEIKMHKVRMYWRTEDEVAEWNERMAWVTDNFGLPGGRWISHAKEDWIDIFFDDDAATRVRYPVLPAGILYTHI